MDQGRVFVRLHERLMMHRSTACGTWAEETGEKLMPYGVHRRAVPEVAVVREPVDDGISDERWAGSDSQVGAANDATVFVRR